MAEINRKTVRTLANQFSQETNETLLKRWADPQTAEAHEAMIRAAREKGLELPETHGAIEEPSEVEQPKNDVEQELDAILAAKAATDAAKASAKKPVVDDEDEAPAPAKASAKEVAEAVKPPRKPAAKKAVVEDADDVAEAVEAAAPAPVKAAASADVGSLLGDLDDLLGSLDD